LPPSLDHPNLELADFELAVKSANLIVLLVSHRAFMHVDRELLKDKFVIDTVGAW
jgi:UDP-N-acetyl-D-mannosaminuronate dehydrogenase